MIIQSRPPWHLAVPSPSWTALAALSPPLPVRKEPSPFLRASAGGPCFFTGSFSVETAPPKAASAFFLNPMYLERSFAIGWSLFFSSPKRMTGAVPFSSFFWKVDSCCPFLSLVCMEKPVISPTRRKQWCWVPRTLAKTTIFFFNSRLLLLLVFPP